MGQAEWVEAVGGGHGQEKIGSRNQVSRRNPDARATFRPGPGF